MRGGGLGVLPREPAVTASLVLLMALLLQSFLQPELLEEDLLGGGLCV